MSRHQIAMRCLTAAALLPGLVLTSGPQPGAQSAQTAADAAVAPPPSFTDPARRAKLATAFADIDGIFTEFTQRSNVPGAAWGIVIDGELVHSGVSGLRDAASGAAVEKDTVFRIASMTKSFTAMAILKLRDDGKLSLEEPAEKYVPELKGLRYPTADSRRIAIRDLLSHAEGFPEDNAWGDRHLADSQDAFSKMMKGGIPFSNTPGVAYEYSNYGFAILGRIVAQASGQPYNDYIAHTILKPLGMSSTTFEPSAVPVAKLALGHKWQDGKWAPEPLLADGAFGAMGGMLTTVPDLAKYVAMLLDAWPPRDRARDRSRAPLVAARDAAGGAAGARNGDARRERHGVAQHRWLWFRPPRVADVRIRPCRCAQRRVAWLRVADALAPGVRRWRHRIR